MKTVRVAEAATARYLFEQAQDGPVLLQEEKGRTFILIQVDRDDAEAFAFAENARLNEILDRSRARARNEGWISTQQIRQELGIE